MAVSRYRSSQSGTSTPDSTPSTPVKSNFDEENVCFIATIDANHDSFRRRIVFRVKQRHHLYPEEQIHLMLRLPKSNRLIFGKVTYQNSLFLFRFSLIALFSELSDNPAGFLGRTFNQAISWVRNSNIRLDASVQTPPLQTCLTYLTLPCDTIIKDLLESNSTPLLTPQ